MGYWQIASCRSRLTPRKQEKIAVKEAKSLHGMTQREAICFVVEFQNIWNSKIMLNFHSTFASHSDFRNNAAYEKHEISLKSP